MGKRCRWAALGATFALLVAACAATTSSETSSVGRPSPPPSTMTSSTGASLVQTSGSDVSVTDALAFTESVAGTSFVQPPSDGTCATTNHAALSVFSPVTGEQRASVSIPRPAPTSTVHGTTAFLGFSFDQGQRPGVGAVDLDDATPLWQRFLDSEPHELRYIDDTLIVVTRENVRGLNPDTGEDLWVLSSQFEIRSIVLGSESLFALDLVGVHAIDAASGEVTWQLAIDRPDTLAASDDFLVVASRTRLIGVDIEAQRRVFDIEVDRNGNDGIWVASEAVVHELSATVAPGGGLAAIDLRTGVERWRNTSLGETVFAGRDVIVASTANAEPNPGAPFILFGLDANTGERLWDTPSTGQVFETVAGVSDDRIVLSQPHQVVAGLHSVRVLNSTDGRTLWEASTDLDIDGAALGAAGFVALFGASPTVGADRGTIALRGVSGQWWTATAREGVLQPPVLSAEGLVVVAGERSAACASRAVGEPATDQN